MSLCYRQRTALIISNANGFAFYRPNEIYDWVKDHIEPHVNRMNQRLDTG